MVQDRRGRARREDGRSATRPTIGGYVFTLRRRARACTGPNYAAAQGTHRRHARRQAGRHAASARSASTRPAQSPMTEAAIDPGLTRDLYVSLGEPVAAATPGSCASTQALRRLDLGRLPADGARRPARRERPALPRARRRARPQPRRRPRRDAGRGDGMKRLWFLIPLAAFLALAGFLARRPASSIRARCRRR